MTIQEYLEKKLGEMAQQDANFRERYEDKQKSLKNCILYIKQQAHKQAVNGCAAISDDALRATPKTSDSSKSDFPCSTAV